MLWNGNPAGPRAVPGEYRARLNVGDWNSEVPFEVLADPRSEATSSDYQSQFEFLIAVRDKVSEVHEAIGRIRETKSQLESLQKRLKGHDEAESVVASVKDLVQSFTDIEQVLYQTKLRSRQDPLNFPIRLNDKLAGLARVASFGVDRPTRQLEQVRVELTQAVDEQLDKLTVLSEGLRRGTAMVLQQSSLS